MPGDELVCVVSDIEENLENGDEEREREYIEHGGEYVHQHGPRHVFLVGSDIALEYLPEFLHKEAKVTINYKSNIGEAVMRGSTTSLMDGSRTLLVQS